MKCEKLIDVIRRELQSPNPEKHFRKVRMYLALGDIGGERAFDLLFRQLDQEKGQESQQRRILRAMGATKDPRAKSILIEHLRGRRHYIAALDGLRYLGDSSTVDVLEEELRKDLSPYQRRMVAAAIAAIRAGDDHLSW
ncbi:HEAT repeat domain-containing protein [Elusimicrobiota bacterium]